MHKSIPLNMTGGHRRRAARVAPAHAQPDMRTQHLRGSANGNPSSVLVGIRASRTGQYIRHHRDGSPCRTSPVRVGDPCCCPTASAIPRLRQRLKTAHIPARLQLSSVSFGEGVQPDRICSGCVIPPSSVIHRALQSKSAIAPCNFRKGSRSEIITVNHTTVLQLYVVQSLASWNLLL